jgi:citrate lyase beta subunit
VNHLHDLRSLLFAPASDERKLRRALDSDADAVIADLEDAVVAREKPAARASAARILADTGRPGRVVRVNGADTEYFEDDLHAISDLSLAAVMLPKATPDAVAALGVDGAPVIAIVETAVGLRLAYETACMPRVSALVLGAADLGAELGLEPRADGQELLFARSTLVIDSAAAGIRPPLDVVHLDTRDGAGLEREAVLARSLGFGGKLCIHPAQIETVNRVFAPTEAQLAWAESAVASYEEGVLAGRGAVSLDGEMIDLPIVERARRLLATAGRERG